MDKTTALGLVVGLGAMVGMVVVEGGELVGLVNLAAAIVVFGGTIGALLTSFPLSDVMVLPRAILVTFGGDAGVSPDRVDFYVHLAEKARREGLLSLEHDADELEDLFARKGLMLVVDGIDPEVVRTVMESELGGLEQRHRRAHRMLDAMGGYAPTMGILGTVMGLVHVLSRLSEPSALGQSIAAAFVATLYGVASANLIWLPLANKLKAKTRAEIEVRRLTLDAVLAIQAGDNPRIVREKLEVHLAPGRRGVSNRARSAGEPKAAEAAA